MMKPIEKVNIATERFHIPTLPLHPPGLALWHIVEQDAPCRVVHPDCPKTGNKEVLVRNLPGDFRVLNWGDFVDVI